MIKLAVNKINNWIFVTGVPRSGTTFVGMTLSLPKQVDYIHEPFNPMCGMHGVDKWYRYLRSDLDTPETKDYHKLVQSILNYDFSLKNNVPSTDNYWRKVFKHFLGSRGPYYLRLAKLNIFHQTAIIKDPIASLLTEYLYDNFQVKPVIIIKHPVSFIASLKRVNFWPHPDKLKDQKYLIKDYFGDEQDFLEQDLSNRVTAAAVFWRIIYKVLLAQAERHPDWQVITHEELSQKPVATFKGLYQSLGIPWSDAIAQKIVNQTQKNSSTDPRKGVVQDFQRNSADIFQTRRDSISLMERKEIFEIVSDVALKVYSKESFAIN
jgi:hypothetical protein